jgi:Pumilio-family RNA binding repeat
MATLLVQGQSTFLDRVTCSMQQVRSSSGCHTSGRNVWAANICHALQFVETAKEQHGCRYLQRLIAGEPPERLQLLLDEILPETGALMVDPFGNYLVQKVLDNCSAPQRRAVLEHACASGLASIARNTHGTRAVQKLVEAVCASLGPPRGLGLVVACCERSVCR